MAKILVLSLFVVAIFNLPAYAFFEGSLKGFSGYEFGMTYKKADAVFDDDKVVKCPYKDAHSCLERKEKFWDLDGVVQASLNRKKKRIDGVYVKLELSENNAECIEASNRILANLTERYGKHDDVDLDTIAWFAKQGGLVKFRSKCGFDAFATVQFTESKPMVKQD